MKSNVVAIDFGTSKVVTLIATAQSFGMNGVDIQGVGKVPYQGFSNGEWNNPAEINQVVSSSIKIAQEQADNKSKITEVYVGIPGEFTHIRVFNVSVDIQGSDPRVKPEHVDEIFKLADEEFNSVSFKNESGMVMQMPGVVIHRCPAWFMVDGGKKTLEPVGQKGRELSAMVCFIVADDCFPNYITRLLGDMGITVKGYCSSLMGQAKLFIPESERDNMAAMMDIGYLNTDFIIVEGDAIIYHETIPIGGGHVSAALAAELGVNLETTAEQLKRRFEFSLIKNDQEYDIPSEEGTKVLTYTQSQLEEIVLPVVDALTDQIKESLDSSGVKLPDKSSIYITGGGLALNRGGREYISSKIGRSVREPAKVTINMTEPYFSSSMGLLDIILATINASDGVDKGVKGFFKNLFGIN